jgi:hypothetical protein
MSLAIVSIIALLILGIAFLIGGVYFTFLSKSDARGETTQASLKDLVTLHVGPQALLIVVGAGFLVFAAWLAVTHPPNSSPVAGSTPTVQASTPSGHTPRPLTEAPTIKITRPSNGSNVRLNDTVEIQVSGAGMARYVWILVQLGSQVYPQGPCNNISLTVTSCPAVRFGDPGMAVGTPYTLTAVLVDSQGNSTYMPLLRNGFAASNPPVLPIASSSQITVHGDE